MIINLINIIGVYFLKLYDNVCLFIVFLSKVIKALFSKKLKLEQIIIQMQNIGVESFTIVFLTGFSTGFALALQSFMGLDKFGGSELIGLVVSLGMTRELAPVLTGIMVTGRAGSAMAAEIGTMKITEQIDALKTLRIDPYQYLIVPRIVAATLSLPLLTIIAMLCGIVGGYIYNSYVVDLNSEVYVSTIKMHLVISDIFGGAVKAAVFGLILSLVSTYMGIYTKDGAHGVGISTTKSVVAGSIWILIANYFLSLILFQVE